MTAKPQPDKTLTARIEVFRPGTFKPMAGDPITYSAADLRAIADAYDPEVAPAPVVVGHPDIDAPAYGWVESFEYDADRERLFANLHQVEPTFAELVQAGRFKKVSMAYFGPSQGHNPVPGTWYPKHLGFLGAAAPGVPGLKNAHFAGASGAAFEVAFGAAEESASLFRKLRDLLIEKFSLEDADRALPSWQIEWLDDQAEGPDFRAYAENPAPPGPTPTPKPPETQKETPVTKEADAAFAARESELSDREKRIADREAAITHTDNAAFAESLVQDGKLLPASRDKVVALMDVLPGHAAVSFAAGADKITPIAALKEILEAQPKIVSFGEADLPESAAASSAAFAAGGREVDPVRMEIHNKALAYQKAHPGTSYGAAVDAVS
ncbi:hypothetical protein [Paracoccus lutimaris]|uniref:Uncharacterized protein n=1 Tax=Paracoccus lutimaris TaxID=1490030 RepID=A0A368YG07_9RHOB|nr:hypothetical protein [Paracoccus lutimaris]RCW77807.1 hypothetical protein DFP89_1561 [Paracoccus lutimaris]